MIIISSGLPAPFLRWNGDKFNRQGTYNCEKNPHGYMFYQAPIPLVSYILSELSGQEGNQIKLMWFLLGTDKGFALSTQTIISRTGMTQQAYSRARKALADRGWIIYDKDNHTVTLDYKRLWEEAKKPRQIGSQIFYFLE